jgi:hypothetical protein
MSEASDRIRAVLVLAATAAMTGFLALSAAGYLNGITMAQVSDKYPTLVTPAPFAFSIWALICLGLTAFSLYQLHPANGERFRTARTLYIVSCVLNCGWIYFWHREDIAASFAFVAVLLAVLLLTYVRLEGCRSVAETWLMQAPFGLYFGWVTALAMMVFTAFLQSAGVAAASSNIFAIILILIATASAVVVRVMLGNFFFPLAIAWGLTAIAIKQGSNTPIILACALAVVTCLITSGSFVMHLRDSTSE